MPQYTARDRRDREDEVATEVAIEVTAEVTVKITVKVTKEMPQPPQIAKAATRRILPRDVPHITSSVGPVDKRATSRAPQPAVAVTEVVAEDAVVDGDKAVDAQSIWQIMNLITIMMK